MKDSLVLHAGSAQALPAILSTLRRYGYRAVQSFDLRSAVAGQPGCACPHHGTDQCTCQYIVLLVYPLVPAIQTDPIVVTMHSHDDKTDVQFVAPASGIALRANGEVIAAERVMLALIETAYGLAAPNRARAHAHASI